ncbi:MAG TPA: triose-phosphate isomerase [Gemmatimonadaceae bacterium]|nr:triose-phosphate isomerase [Gemmatimonadaceae bacterium]
MMRGPVFAANWKMNHGPHDAKAFVRTFVTRYARKSDRVVAIFPPSITVPAVAEALKERADILIGVQNIHWEDKGAYTGEISAPLARDAGASLALVGHSERRHVFGETDAETALKCIAAARAGLKPMLCVGEKIEERESGLTESVVLRQLRAGIAPLDPAHIAAMFIAYEPVWAIGTGRTATPEDAAAVHAIIRRELQGVIGAPAARIPILYGGSANTGNAAPLLAAPEVGGLLVGGASLDPDSWLSIVRT